MMLLGLDGAIGADTAAPARTSAAFPFPSLLQDAAEQNQGTALVTLGNRLYWIVVVPVRAPVPIAFIAACIPVDNALLEKMRAISSAPHSIVMATITAAGRWNVEAHTSDYVNVDLPPASSSAQNAEIVTRSGDEYLVVSKSLQTAPGSRPVMAVLDYPLAQALGAYRSVIMPILVLLGLALLAALAGATLIVRHVARPLEALSEAARRIAAGDYAHPPKVERRDEFGHLADALTNMAQSIAERETALKGAIDAAELARREAVKANEAKSQFLANMSHELRTPLNAIVGFSEMLEQQVLGPVGVPRYVEYAHDILDSGHHLLGLVEHMLDLAEGESHRLNLVREPISPGVLLLEAANLHRGFADKSGVGLHLPDNLAEWPQIQGDAAKLRQGFADLLHNAVKFTPAGGAVTISGVSNRSRLSIRIVDNGVGIEHEQLTTVVRPFHRLRPAFDGQHQGAGLGLPFAKLIVELHGGVLTLSSTVGVGTTVAIELPALVGALHDAA
jgi:signal transduction histidine kinase